MSEQNCFYQFARPNEKYIDFLVSLKDSGKEIWCFPIKAPNNRLDKASSDGLIGLIFSNRDDTSSIYHVTSCGWRWNVEEERIAFKAAIWMLWQFDIPLFGAELPQDVIDGILRSNTSPASHLKSRPGNHWHPDDYVLPDSRVAKDIDEALSVLKHLQDTGHYQATLDKSGRSEHWTCRNNLLSIKQRKESQLLS